jgi:hypothetical protein
MHYPLILDPDRAVQATMHYSLILDPDRAVQATMHYSLMSSSSWARACETS